MLPYLTVRHIQTVGVNDPSCLEVRVKFSNPMQKFLYERSSLSRMTDAYIYLLKTVLELGPTDQRSDTLTTRTLGVHLEGGIFAQG